MVMDPHQMHDIEVMNMFVQQSPVHNWGPLDACRLLLPPVTHNQYIILREPMSGAVGFCTWGYFDDKTSAKFLNRTGRVQPHEWDNGPHPWIMDIVSPDGHVMELIRAARAKMCEQVKQRGYGSLVRWTRTYGTGVVQRIGSFELCGTKV